MFGWRQRCVQCPCFSSPAALPSDGSLLSECGPTQQQWPCWLPQTRTRQGFQIQLRAFLGCLVRCDTEEGRDFSRRTLAARYSFFSLFAFLSIAQLLQFQAWWQIRQERPSQCLAATVQRLWALTEIAPAPIALIIFLTGLRLIWDKPAKNAPSELWLSALIASFSVFFFDGIVGYQPAVRKMLRYWSHAAKENVPVSVAARAWNATSDSVQLFLHFLSWPFVFALGVLRPSQPNPIGPAIARFQSQVRFLPAGWPEVISAFALWALIGALVLLVRTSLRPIPPQKGKDALGVSW